MTKHNEKYVSLAVTAAVSSGRSDHIIWTLRHSGLNDVTEMTFVLAEALARISDVHVQHHHRVDL